MERFSSRFAWGVGIGMILVWGGALPAGAEAPTMALRAVVINDLPIEPTEAIAVDRGDRIEVEIHIWGWGEEIPEGIDRFSAGVLNRRGAVSGQNGTILPEGWDAPLDSIRCNPQEPGNCPPETICVGVGDLGLCRGEDHFPSIGARVELARADYVFFDLATIEGVATAQLDYTYFGLIKTPPGQSRVDEGGVWYAGSLSLVVSDTACGVFTFFLSRCSGLTLLGALDGPEIEPVLMPLTIDAGACPLLPTTTTPPNCAVDARRAFAGGTDSDPVNWDRVIFQFDRSPAGTSPAEFAVTVVPEASPPQIVDLDQVGGATLILALDRPISPQHWTCIEHLPSSRVACFGSLPVDVDQSLLATTDDIAALRSHLRGEPLVPEFRCDMDRSLTCSPIDLLAAIDLLSGASSPIWEGSTIDASCPSDSSAIFRDPVAGDRGACCSPTSGSCQENQTVDECLADGGVWTAEAPCCGAACTASLGACCDEASGACREAVLFADCQEPGESWTAETTCDAAECGQPRGACCDTALGGCADEVLESQCQGPEVLWREGQRCSEVECRSG